MSDMSDDDKRWHEDKYKNGWVMPCAPKWKRLPIIRTIRAYWHNYQSCKIARQFGSLGIGLGWQNPYDSWVIYGIATGKERHPVLCNKADRTLG